MTSVHSLGVEGLAPYGTAGPFRLYFTTLAARAWLSCTYFPTHREAVPVPAGNPRCSQGFPAATDRDADHVKGCRSISAIFAPRLTAYWPVPVGRPSDARRPYEARLSVLTCRRGQSGLTSAAAGRWLAAGKARKCGH